MRVTFSNPLIKNMSGKVSKDSNLYYMTRNGVTYLCRRTKKNPIPNPSPEGKGDKKGEEAKRRQEKFKQMVAMVNEIMATTTLKQQYVVAWKKQKKYSTLRGYIAHCVSQNGGITTA